MSQRTLSPARPVPEAIRDSEAGSELAARVLATRRLSTALAEPLSDEDQTVQANDDASPTKWHLAHTTWFYETFLLAPFLPSYRVFSPAFQYCFNSYYETQGPRQPRPRRGLLTRPSAAEVRNYRAHVDAALEQLLAARAGEPEIAALVELGINHEQQHQELILTDILSLFAASPLRPAYRAAAPQASRRTTAPELRWLADEGGIREIGHEGRGFHFDNEGPRHRALIQPHALASRCVTNGEWLEFMRDGGYGQPTLWLADGWAAVLAHAWEAPGYWELRDGAWHQMTLDGLLPVDPDAPASHVNYYEADAFARWAGRRLPTEFEWETAAANRPVTGNMLATGRLRPMPAEESDGERPTQLFGDVWEWTQSAYLPYPGYRPPAGAIGEYNGKFMCNQHVLRGASCVTPQGHARATYRNFFYPHQRWQFTGLRLAGDQA
jgi:ergothioneine biosynthesis protein EgtB